MSDAMTTVASLDYDQTMWDRGIYYSLRPELHFDQFADVKTTTASPADGAALTFTIVTDMAAATASINESVDIDAVALADTQVTLTLAEKGNAVNTTWRVRATAFVDLDPVVANAVGYNAGMSIDLLARTALEGGSNVRYATGGATDPTARNTVEPGDIITAHDVRLVVADLEAANVPRFNGYYAGVLHPHVALDLREETGAAAWRDPHTYSDPSMIWSGEVGAFEGVRWMTSSRAPLWADAGSSTTLTDVYGTLVFGRQALAKAYSTYEGRGPLPITIIGPVIDKLKRFKPVGWHWFGAYGRFREAAIRRIESSSTVGTNS